MLRIEHSLVEWSKYTIAHTANEAQNFIYKQKKVKKKWFHARLGI